MRIQSLVTAAAALACAASLQADTINQPIGFVCPFMVGPSSDLSAMNSIQLTGATGFNGLPDNRLTYLSRFYGINPAPWMNVTLGFDNPLFQLKIGADTFTCTALDMHTTLATQSRNVEEGIAIVDDGMGHTTPGTYRLSFFLNSIQQTPFPFYAGEGTASIEWFPTEPSTPPTTSSPVPDGGTTAILLSSAFAGLALTRRKLA